MFLINKNWAQDTFNKEMGYKLEALSSQEAYDLALKKEELNKDIILVLKYITEGAGKNIVRESIQSLAKRILNQLKK